MENQYPSDFVSFCGITNCRRRNPTGLFYWVM